MVVPKIQQVTTRSKGKQSEWEVQEVVRKTAKEWVEEANNNNVMSMLHENVAIEDGLTVDQIASKITPYVVEAKKVLVDCQVSLPFVTS